MLLGASNPYAYTTSHYEALGVSSICLDEDVNRSFKRRAMEHHPDKSTDSKSGEMFKRIQAARSVLMDPTERSTYDASILGLELRNLSNSHQTQRWEPFYSFPNSPHPLSYWQADELLHRELEWVNELKEQEPTTERWAKFLAHKKQIWKEQMDYHKHSTDARRRDEEADKRAEDERRRKHADWERATRAGRVEEGNRNRTTRTEDNRQAAARHIELTRNASEEAGRLSALLQSQEGGASPRGLLAELDSLVISAQSDRRTIRERAEKHKKKAEAMEAEGTPGA